MGDIAAIVAIIGGVSTAVGFIFKTAIKGSLYPISSRMDSLIDSLDRLNQTFDITHSDSDYVSQAMLSVGLNWDDVTNNDNWHWVSGSVVYYI